jgi:hypothetical protein
MHSVAWQVKKIVLYPPPLPKCYEVSRFLIIKKWNPSSNPRLQRACCSTGFNTMNTTCHFPLAAWPVSNCMRTGCTECGRTRCKADCYLFKDTVLFPHPCSMPEDSTCGLLILVVTWQMICSMAWNILQGLPNFKMAKGDYNNNCMFVQ